MNNLQWVLKQREAMKELSGWVAERQLQWKDHIVEGIEAAVASLDMLFTGKNEGKLLVRISPE